MVVLQIRVKPNARASSLEERDDGTWQARIKARPVEGRANEELVALVARHFALSRARVVIKSGAAGRVKWVHVDDS